MFKDQDPSRVIVSGFSQGCAATLATTLRYKGQNPLGGAVAMSCWTPLAEDRFANNKDVQE